MSVSFNIPFNGLCQGMQVMHRSGFSVTGLNTDHAKGEGQVLTNTGNNDLKTENAPKSSDPKTTELKSESKSESTKAEKKSTQKNRRQRRK
ncbi:hypothetical protein MITS9509_00055 [Synechococcus sp. MIT S9509]|uniref:hypothetical protein n=1 Tax=unclassified Synechococcus TaxID=2626047 RepID=UPI0007BB920E|nr:MULTISPECIES: hypothetical protein [unclassified Synechococcus]KZR86393.1 hypothetical protein MITS9504_01410 [Synechococcus sp. MIT S9504]KZR93469.1 hypothetical protein MITS9509_00055 [Synechococcus sp. MIT S9509]